MRNLKRALSLALAAVMVLSMMVIGAGAVSIDDFSDKDEIVNTEAVTTMVSLGVINGKDDGSYDPTGIVTRAEMAKLIAVTLNGGKDPTLGSITADFTDTKGHWAESYIAYVASLGIIDGRGDGTFGPNDQVTGAQAAKMILTMLGYRSDIEGFTGPTWAISVQTKGNDIDLFADMLINPDEGLTRDDTAQMLYNGVQSWMVEYRNLEGSYDGIVYPQPLNGTKANSTMLLEKFKVAKVTGVVEATSLISLSGSTTVEGKTRLSDVEYLGTRYDDDFTYPIAVDSKYLGYRVVLYVKGLNSLSPNASNMEVVGSYIVSDDNTAVITSARLKDTDAVKDALKGSGISMAKAGADCVYISDTDTAWGTTNGVRTMPGVEQTFIDNNGDGTVDVVVQKNPGLAKINTYNEKDESMNISTIGTVDFVDVLNPKDVAQGDYVLVYNYDGVYVLAQAETVSGVVSAFVNNATNINLSKITIDGTNYGIGSGKNLAPDVMDLVGAAMSDLVDGTYTLYLDPHGNILGYVEDEGAIGNYAVITGVNPTGSKDGFYSVEVKLILADGSTGKYDVNLLASAKKWNATTNGAATNNLKEAEMYKALTGDTDNDGDADTATAVGTLVSYSMNNGVVTLVRPEYTTNNYHETTSAANLQLQNSKAAYTFGAGKLMADDKTVFFIKDSTGSYTTVNGLKNLRSTALNTIGTSQAIYYEATGSNTKVARAIFAEVNAVYSSNSNYAFVTGNYTKTTSGTDTIYTYPVVLSDGTVTTLQTKIEDNVGSSLVHEYQVDGEFVTFDNNVAYVVNEKVVTGTGSNAVSVADADNIATGKDSYPTAGATVWNVEDTDNVFKTSLQKNDLVALVLDEDGNVKTAFVYDRQADDMTSEVAGAAAPVKSAGTLDLTKGTWTGVADKDTLSFNFTLGANQTAKISVSADANTKGTTSNNGTEVAKGGTFNGTVYTAGANENGGKVTVKITVSEAGKSDRIYNYVITVSATQATASTTTERTIAKTGNGTLTESTDKTSATLNGIVKAGDKLQLKVDPAAASDVVVKSITVSGLSATGACAVNTDLDGTTAADIYTIQPGDEGKTGTVTVVAKISEAGKLDLEETYTFTITVSELYKYDSTNYAVGETVTVNGLTATKTYYLDGKVITASGTTHNFTMPAHDVAAAVEVFELTPKANLTGANGVLATKVELSGANLITDGGKYYVEAGKAVTATVTLQGTAETATKVELSAGTVTSISAGTVTNGVTDGTTKLVITKDGGTGVCTFTFTAAAKANITVTIANNA